MSKVVIHGKTPRSNRLAEGEGCFYTNSGDYRHGSCLHIYVASQTLPTPYRVELHLTPDEMRDLALELLKAAPKYERYAEYRKKYPAEPSQ